MPSTTEKMLHRYSVNPMDTARWIVGNGYREKNVRFSCSPVDELLSKARSNPQAFISPVDKDAGLVLRESPSSAGAQVVEIGGDPLGGDYAKDFASVEEALSYAILVFRRFLAVQFSALLRSVPKESFPQVCVYSDELLLALLSETLQSSEPIRYSPWVDFPPAQDVATILESAESDIVDAEVGDGLHIRKEGGKFLLQQYERGHATESKSFDHLKDALIPYVESRYGALEWIGLETIFNDLDTLENGWPDDSIP